jgi:hypothetical protein
MNTQQQLRQALRQDYQQALAHDRFGMSVAARLSDATDALPNDISERLRVARAQAVAKRKLAPALSKAPRTASVVLANGSSATLGNGDDDFGLWGRITAALPLIALVVGLVSIHFIQNERRANEIAEIDAALLIDDLPPAAYTDPGFVQFLKAKRDMQQ